MNKFYRRLVGLILLVVLISGVVIYTTVDINTLYNLTMFQPWSIAIAILAVALGMFFDGSRLMHLVDIAHERITLYQALQVIFGNYFLALLTPGATGGSVAQMMFLCHAKVPAGKAAIIVLVRTASSIFFLMLCMPLILLHDGGIMPGVSDATLMGVMIAVIIMTCLTLLAAREGLLDYLVIRMAKRMGQGKRHKTFIFYRDFKTAVGMLASTPKGMLVVFAESGLNLLCIYAIVPCLLLGLGVTDADWYTIMGRMIFLNMMLYFMPTPGGAGIAEGGFVYLFASTVPAGTVGIIAVCWRLIAEYIPFVIGFYYTIKVFGKDYVSRKLESDRMMGA